MSGAELALGIVGAVAAVDVAIKCGSTFVHTCSAFKHANSELGERVLRIKSRWYRTKSQLEFLYRVWPRLDHEHRELQHQLLAVLVSALGRADSKVSSFLEDRPVAENAEGEAQSSGLGLKKKFKYALLRKTLDETIAIMQSWQYEFDPSWFLILKVGSTEIDKELSLNGPPTDNALTTASSIRDALRETPQQAVSVLLPKEALEAAQFQDLSFSTAKLAQRLGSTKWLILDSISCSSLEEYQQRIRNVRDLSAKLTRCDPLTFALLNCRGFVAYQAELNYTLVFKTPENMYNPQSLRSALVAANSNHSLSDRFALSRQLARAVCSVHTFGLVHKSIRPENILLFREPASELGSAFLVGFESFRPEEGWTRLRSDQDWEKNLYRHPQRQAIQLQDRDRYIMQHDIYSLGVCLLEIGLWSSFIQYSDRSPDPTRSQGHTFYEAVLEGASSSVSVKQQLLALSKDPLRRQMGNKYAHVVATCLTCLDEGNEEFGDESEFQDEDGVLVAVRYIERILLQLSNISV